MSYFEELTEFIEKIAEKNQEDAAYGGFQHDGGYRAIMTQISIWKAGLKGDIPKEWAQYVKDFNREKDPEYETYLRLKNKFE